MRESGARSAAGQAKESGAQSIGISRNAREWRAWGSRTGKMRERGAQLAPESVRHHTRDHSGPRRDKEAQSTGAGQKCVRGCTFGPRPGPLGQGAEET